MSCICTNTISVTVRKELKYEKNESFSKIKKRKIKDHICNVSKKMSIAVGLTDVILGI